MEKYKLSDFAGEIEPGSQGPDVAKIQEILKLIGYGKNIDPEEIKTHTFGKTSQEAANKWKEDAAKAPGLLNELGQILLQIIFHIDREELLHPELQRGHSHAIKQFRDVNATQIAALEAGVHDAKGTTKRIVNMANQFRDIRETGNNHGAADVFTGLSGEAWCGGFVHYVMEHSVPGVYDQSTFNSALSYKKEGQNHHAFHEANDLSHLRAGDVLVFTRGGEKGHVGVVTSVTANGDVTYVSGNDGNAVRERSFNLHNDVPPSLLGYTDTQALAADKGITVIHDEPQLAAIKQDSLRIAKFSQKAIQRG